MGAPGAKAATYGHTPGRLRRYLTQQQRPTDLGDEMSENKVGGP